MLQSQKFDPDGVYIRRWVPELCTFKGQSIHAPWEHADSSGVYLSTNYPQPIINHYEARAIALNYYKQLKKKDLT